MKVRVLISSVVPAKSYARLAYHNEQTDTVVNVFEIDRNRRKGRSEGEGAGMGAEKRPRR